MRYFAILMLLGPLVSGCATIEGAGEDIEQTGEVIQEEADTEED